MLSIVHLARGGPRVAALAAVVLMLSAAGLFAQPAMKVAARTPLRAAASTAGAVVTTVAEGTVVEVLGRDGNFTRVLLPTDSRGVRLAGYILTADLAPAPAQSTRPTAKPSTGSVPDKPQGTTTPARPGAAQAPPRAGAARPAKPPAWYQPVRARAFADVGYVSFLAANSFGAVFDSSRAVLFGGGAEVAFGRNMFIRAGVGRMSMTGQRAVVYNGEVFRLGIAETLTLTPFEVTAGWAVRPYHGWRPYVAGGITVMSYNEESALAQASDNVKASYAGFHLLGGIEVPVIKHVGVAGEFQYTGIPGAIGKDGVSKDFNETNLGGTSLRLKLLIGW